MDIRIFDNKIYKCMKQTNSVAFLMISIVLSILTMILLSCFSDRAFDGITWELLSRFIIGMPLLLQLFLTYIVYRKNRNRRIIMILWVATLFYTVVCGVLALYDLYFTKPNFGDDLLFQLCFSQLLFQTVLLVIFVLFMFLKLVNKQVVIKSLVVFMISVLLIIAGFGSTSVCIDYFGYYGYYVFFIPILINCYSPMLLFILCNIAKDKVFKN